MKFEELIIRIQTAHGQLRNQALRSMNQALVLRNWAIGYYIVNYEQGGTDRAKYGQKLLKSLSTALKAKKIKGMSETNLKLFRSLYFTYPHFGQPLADFIT